MRPATSIATIVIAALIAACGGGAHAQRAEPAPPGGPELVVVGDSLAAGRFAGTPAEAFPQEVAAAMRARLALLAAPGATTTQLAAQVVPGRGDAVVVEAGTNDFLYQTPRRRFADDYRALLAKVEAASPGARLVCLTTWVPKGVTPRQPATIPVSFYDKTIRRACTAGTVADLSPLTDARGPSGRETFLGPGDDFHPNSTGHAEIARLIESRLR